MAENLALGRGFETSPAGRIRWRALRRHAETVLNRFHIDVDPGAPVDRLRRAAQTMVAIARALQDQDDAKEGILVLDEPTSSLPLAEVTTLLSALRRYATEGQTILLVTHRLEKAALVADRATMLRDGRLIKTLDRSQITHARLVELMLGKRVKRAAGQMTARSRGDVVLRARGISGGCPFGGLLRVRRRSRRYCGTPRFRPVDTIATTFRARATEGGHRGA